MDGVIEDCKRLVEKDEEESRDIEAEWLSLFRQIRLLLDEDEEEDEDEQERENKDEEEDKDEQERENEDEEKNNLRDLLIDRLLHLQSCVSSSSQLRTRVEKDIAFVQVMNYSRDDFLKLPDQVLNSYSSRFRDFINAEAIARREGRNKGQKKVLNKQTIETAFRAKKKCVVCGRRGRVFCDFTQEYYCSLKHKAMVVKKSSSQTVSI